MPWRTPSTALWNVINCTSVATVPSDMHGMLFKEWQYFWSTYMFSWIIRCLHAQIENLEAVSGWTSQNLHCAYVRQLLIWSSALRSIFTTLQWTVAKNNPVMFFTPFCVLRLENPWTDYHGNRYWEVSLKFFDIFQCWLGLYSTSRQLTCGPACTCVCIGTKTL